MEQRDILEEGSFLSCGILDLCVRPLSISYSERGYLSTIKHAREPLFSLGKAIKLLLQMNSQKREINALVDNFDTVLATLTSADLNNKVESLDIRLFNHSRMEEMCIMLDNTNIDIPYYLHVYQLIYMRGGVGYYNTKYDVCTKFCSKLVVWLINTIQKYNTLCRLRYANCFDSRIPVAVTEKYEEGADTEMYELNESATSIVHMDPKSSKVRQKVYDALEKEIFCPPKASLLGLQI